MLLTAGPAPALQKVSAAGKSVGGSALKAKAVCPKGKRVVSGGYAADSEEIASVNKRAGKRAWVVKAINVSKLTGYAYCSASLRPKPASKTVTGEAIGRTKAVARCPGQKTAVAGGWRFGLNSNSPVFASSGSGGRAWTVKGFSDDGPDDDLKAFAYCLGRGGVKVRSAKSDPIPEDADGQATARCKPGEELLGGGHSTSPKSDFFNDEGPDLFYSRTLRVKSRAWRASAHNYSIVAGRITAKAVCL